MEGAIWGWGEEGGEVHSNFIGQSLLKMNRAHLLTVKFTNLECFRVTDASQKADIWKYLFVFGQDIRHHVFLLLEIQQESVKFPATPPSARLFSPQNKNVIYFFFVLSPIIFSCFFPFSLVIRVEISNTY